MFYLLPFSEPFLIIAHVPYTEMVVSSMHERSLGPVCLDFFSGFSILNLIKNPLFNTENTYLNNLPTYTLRLSCID